MKQPLDGAVVLVTGGTGSLGQSLVRRLLRLEIGAPSKIIVFSRDEAKQYAMKTAWKHAHAATDDIYLLELRGAARVLDRRRARRRVGPAALDGSDVVIHAAAMKQVPTCEYFPSQAVATNVPGAHNIVDALARTRACRERVIAISTDKACKPVNVMGMTKAMQERIVLRGEPRPGALPLRRRPLRQRARSRGSVIPLFHDQIAHGGPVTITTAGDDPLPAQPRSRRSTPIFDALRWADRGDISSRVASARDHRRRRVLIGDQARDDRDRHPAGREAARDPGVRRGGHRTPSGTATT